MELAKRIEAGLFAEEKLADNPDLDHRDPDQARGSQRMAAGPRTTCWATRLVVSLAKRYTGRGDVVPGPHPGRQPGADPRGREVRLHQGLQVLDVRHMVDPTGDHARDGGSGPDHPDPGHMVEVINKAGSRVQRQMLQDLGREPTPEELAKELDMTPDKVVEVQKYGREPISLSRRSARTATGIRGSDRGLRGHRARGRSVLHPSPGATGIGARHAFRARGGVVRMRFGLSDGQPKTLDEIGKVYGVTRERIRQIESKTMSKLRHPSRSQVLRDYLD